MFGKKTFSFYKKFTYTSCTTNQTLEQLKQSSRSTCSQQLIVHCVVGLLKQKKLKVFTLQTNMAKLFTKEEFVSLRKILKNWYRGVQVRRLIDDYFAFEKAGSKGLIVKKR